MLCPFISVAESTAGMAEILEFNEDGGLTDGGDGGDAGGGDTGGGGGGVTDADADVAGGGGGEAGGGDGAVVPDEVTVTMRGTVMSRALDPVSQM